MAQKLSLEHTKFIDNINVNAELPKAFGLPEICDKSIFPHLFNTCDNQMYIDPLSVSYYASETVQTEERECFLAWHAEMKYHRKKIPYSIFNEK